MAPVEIKKCDASSAECGAGEAERISATHTNADVDNAPVQDAEACYQVPPGRTQSVLVQFTHKGRGKPLPYPVDDLPWSEEEADEDRSYNRVPPKKTEIIAVECISRGRGTPLPYPVDAD